MEWLQDEFYDVSDLSLEKRIDIIDYAKNVCFKWHVDKLDCNISCSRQLIDMSYEDIMEKFDMSCHFVAIHRRGNIKWKNKTDSIFDTEWCGEIGFCTMRGEISYYL